MELAIIIVNWNTRELLVQCLTSIYAHPPNRDFEIFVVDNASNDGSAQIVREKFPSVRLIENRENVGFARANNQAIGETAATHMLFLNSDTVVQGDALSRLLDFMQAHPNVGIVGASLFNLDGTPQPSRLNFPSFWSEMAFALGLDSRLPFSIWFRPSRDSGDDSLQCDCVPGAAFMVRRAVLDTIGLFDEKFFMYSEEVDLQLRAKKVGWENYILHSARILHLGGKSTRQSAAAMKAELIRSKIYFFHKHHSRVATTALGWVFRASILGRILRYHFLGDQSRKDLWIQVQQCVQVRKLTDRSSGNCDRDSFVTPIQPVL